MSSKNEGLFELLDRGKAVIYGFVASFIFDIIDIKPNKLELILIVVLVFLIWIILSEYIKKGLDRLKTLKTNIQLKKVMFNLIEVITYLGVFLVVKFLLNFIESQSVNIDTNLFESFVGLFVILLIAFTVLNTIKTLQIK